MTIPAPNPALDSSPVGCDSPLPAARLAGNDRPLILAWARAHGLRPDQCEDVAQETLARLLASPLAFDCRAAQIAWLRLVTSNLCVDALRRKRPLMLADDWPASLPAPSVSPDERRALREAIESLPEMQRLVLVAKAVENVTFAVLASDLEVSISTVKTHYRRAIEALRQRLHAIDPYPEQQP